MHLNGLSISGVHGSLYNRRFRFKYSVKSWVSKSHDEVFNQISVSVYTDSRGSTRYLCGGEVLHGRDQLVPSHFVVPSFQMSNVHENTSPGQPFSPHYGLEGWESLLAATSRTYSMNQGCYLVCIHDEEVFRKVFN
jgi:hypothetical protein